jgi:mono/diheme cytochrome c family protein
MTHLITRMLNRLGRRLPAPRLNMGRSAVLLAGLATGVVAYGVSRGGNAETEQAARGQYLVRFGGCTDCHTPGHLLGKPDMSRFLGGSDMGHEVPGLGIFVGPNLTPDNETGLGTWSKDQIATAIQTGVRPDGRVLAPIMPWRAYAGLTKTDIAAVVEYLRTLPPVSHKVPGPFGVNENPAIFRMKILTPADAGHRD